MKIAIVVGGFPALSETFILNQITGLIDLGHDVEIFAEGKGEDRKIHPDVQKYDLLSKTHYIDKEIPKNKVKRIYKAAPLVLKIFFKNPIIAIKTFNFFKFGKDALTLRLLFFVIHFLDKDIIHCHFGPNGLEYLFLKDILPAKFITTFHGFDMSKYLIQEDKNVYRPLFEKGDLFLPISKFWKNRLIELGCQEDKILVHYMGIDIEKIAHSISTRSNNGKVRILTISRLVEKKGLEYSIKAVHKASSKFSNIEYIIIGDGPLRKDIELLISSLNIADKVYLYGWLDSTSARDILQSSDIFILASVTARDGDQEGIPVSLMEAFAIGLPVISTYHTGIPELVIDSKSGFLVPERNVDALAEKLEYLMNHPETWPDMGKAGRKIVEENFDINKLNKQLVNIYSGVKK